MLCADNLTTLDCLKGDKLKKERHLRTKKDDIKLAIDFSLIGLSLLSILLLFFSPTRKFLYGVFGYSIYVYLPAVAIYLFFSFAKLLKKINSKSLVMISLLILSIISTIHVATNKAIITSSDSSYILDPYYQANTAGGLFMSLLSYVFVAISRDYGFVLVCVFIVMATVLLMTIYPLVLMIGRGIRGDKKVNIKKNSMPDTSQVFSNAHADDEIAIDYEDDFINSSYQKAHSTLFESNQSSETGVDNQGLFSSLKNVDIESQRASSASAKILFEEQNRTNENESSKFKMIDRLDEAHYSKGDSNKKHQTSVLSDQRPRNSDDILFGSDVQSFEKPFGNDYCFDQKPAIKDMTSLFGKQDATESVDYEKKKKDKLSAIDYINTPYSPSEYEEFAKNSPLTGYTGQRVAGINPVEKNTNDKTQTDPYDSKVNDVYMKNKSPLGSDIGEVAQTSIDDFNQSISDYDDVIKNDNEVEHVQEFVDKPAWKKRLEDKRETRQESITQQISLDEHLENIGNISSEKERAKDVNITSKPKIKRRYIKPPIDLLQEQGDGFSPIPEDYDFIKGRIDQTMSEFDVPASVIKAQRGPTFTRYELALGEGYQVTKLARLIDNLKMRLEVKNIRLLAPIGGKNAFGLEIPNKQRLKVGLRSIITSARFSKPTDGIDLCFGMTNEGEEFITDLTKMPHMLVAGASGTGKSVFLNCIITGLLYKYSPDELRLVLVDPKRVELNKYKGLPHLLVSDTIKEYHEAVNVLNILVKEMDKRYRILEEASCANISEYNEIYPDKKMHKIVLIIDEMADLMMKNKASTEIEDSIVRLAQLARASGIHMVLATQRPVVDVITGLIKSNIVSRVAFTVQNGRDSSIILDETGAEELLGLGDMLFSSPSTLGLVRMQGAFVSSNEIIKVCNFVRENNTSDFDEELSKKIAYNPKDDIEVEVSSSERAEERRAQRLEDDEVLAQEVLKFFIMRGNASISSAQTKFSIGYVKAKRIVEMLDERGYLGPETKGSTPRSVEISMAELDDLISTGKF